MKEFKVGDKAPSFTLATDEGTKLSLKDFKGTKVVLYFYPKDMTPGCITQACGFRDSATGFKKKKTVILGISKDSVESHGKFRDKHQLNFPLLSDPDGKTCEAYGVWKEKSLYGRKFMGIVRSTFVIGPDGKFTKIFSKVRVAGHIEAVLSEI